MVIGEDPGAGGGGGGVSNGTITPPPPDPAAAFSPKAEIHTMVFLILGGFSLAPRPLQNWVWIQYWDVFHSMILS